jgi:tRNA pseudouridine38-40 synthase
MKTMNERCIKLTVAYDGSDFCGWQRQTGRRAVQSELEKALQTMHGHAVPITAAGRTDTGVHAVGQVVHFHTDIATIPAAKFRLALNKLMPQDVRVTEAVEAHHDFHARYDARLRQYKYYLRFDCQPLPHLDRYAWHLQHKPNVVRLNRLASCLRGEIDCTAFSSAKDPHDNRYRYLHHALFYMEQDTMVFDVAANAFLWHMVRSLVGTLIQLDKEGAEEPALRAIIESGNRRLAGVTAPAQGLFLWKVEYYAHPTRKSFRRSPAQDCAEVVQPGRLVPGLGFID